MKLPIEYSSEPTENPAIDCREIGSEYICGLLIGSCEAASNLVAVIIVDRGNGKLCQRQCRAMENEYNCELSIGGRLAD